MREIYKTLVRIKCPPFPFLHEDLPNNGEFEVLCVGINEQDAKRRVLRAFTHKNKVDEYLEHSLVEVLRVEKLVK